jgi:hypothetical protein
LRGHVDGVARIEAELCERLRALGDDGGFDQSEHRREQRVGVAVHELSEPLVVTEHGLRGRRRLGAHPLDHLT